VIWVIGEILFDVFPNYRRLGGAPFNFAYHLKNFGFDIRFLSRIGKDPAGKEILEKLAQYQFDPSDIQIDDVHPTGAVNVRLDEKGVPQFDILPNVAYDYIEFLPKVHSEPISRTRLIYFGSLVQRTKLGFDSIQAMITGKNPAARCFYDINLRPGCYNNMLIFKSLSESNVLKLNREEFDKLKQIMRFEGGRHAFVQYLLERYPLEFVSLTLGDRGSELFTKSGYYRTDPAKVASAADTVGAGDAYAAMLAAGILRDWQPEEILQRASMFASRICEIKGAIPASPSFYKPFKSLFENG
jgi:fructokinase